MTFNALFITHSLLAARTQYFIHIAFYFGLIKREELEAVLTDKASEQIKESMSRVIYIFFSFVKLTRFTYFLHF